jgi:hypothetical protein
MLITLQGMAFARISVQTNTNTKDVEYKAVRADDFTFFFLMQDQAWGTVSRPTNF